MTSAAQPTAAETARGSYHTRSRRRGDGLIGKQLAYRLVSPMIGPQTFTVLAGEAGVNASVEVRDVHLTIAAVGDVSPIDQPSPQ